MTEDPDFYAWLDGELAEPEASAMAAKIAADPELAAFAAQHRALGVRLQASFAAVSDAPVPPRLEAAARPRPAEVVDLAAARARRRGWGLAGLAVAASLAFGVVLGGSLRGGDDLFRDRQGELAATGPLAAALDRQLASAGDQAGIRIGLTFKDRAGRYCRTFSAGAQSGLACRSGDDWRIEGVVRGAADSTDYRMAAGSDPALGALVDSWIAGDPLDADEEAKLVARGWR